MKERNRSRLILAWMVGYAPLAHAEPQPSDKPRRYVEEGVLVSTALPFLRLHVDPAFKYLGNDEFILKGLAEVDQHLFVVAKNGRIERMIVVQFEGLLPASRGTYQHGTDSHPIKLGENNFLHNTWFVDDGASAREEPGAEPDRRRKFVQGKRYQLDDELMMSRFARNVDEAQRHELIVFYFENVRDAGYTLADFEKGGKAFARKAEYEKAFTERSLKSFAIQQG